MIKKKLEKICLSYKLNRWHLKSKIEYLFRDHLSEFIIIFLTVVGLYFTYQFQKISEQYRAFPFFQYNYNKGSFNVSGDSRISITKTEWNFFSEPSSNSGQWEFNVINKHPNSLSYYDIRDYFAWEIGVNMLAPSGKNIIDCNMHLFSEVGIPALVSITYDQNSKKGLVSEDFVLITRLDTCRPEAIVRDRNIKNIDNTKLFDEYNTWFSVTLDQMREAKKGPNNGCGLIMNQSIEEYNKWPECL